MLTSVFMTIISFGHSERLASLAKMSKCAKSYLKSEEAILKDRLDENDSLIGTNSDLDMHSILSGIGSDKSPCTYSKIGMKIYTNCKHIHHSELQNNQSILIDFNNGGLGNQMSSFASTFALASKLNLKQMLTHRSHAMLSKYFKFPASEILESYFCHPCEDIEFTSITESFHPSGQVLFMPAYPNIISIYREYLDTFRSIFRLQGEYQDRAQDLLLNVKRKSKLENPTFVAIHNRRGDYKYAIKDFGGKIVERKFFEMAIGLYKGVIKNIVFVVVSDDIEWAKENIVGEDIFYSDDDDSEEAVGTDLAIMANCNHTIMTYGTFGMWGAFLANGMVIAADNAAKDDQKKLLRHDGRERWMFVDEEKSINEYKDDILELFHG